MTDDIIAEVAQLLKKSENILFVTGAGISADSGLPTYRGIGGLYNETTTEDGVPIETALAGEMLETNPEVTWKYLSQIEKNCRQATFNEGHRIMAEMENHFSRVWVLTQNIDGFHHQAGSHHVIEIHGNFRKIFCPHCSWRTTINDFSEITIPPLCPQCQRIVRPDVVFFGEMLPEHPVQTLISELQKGFDLYVWIGTTCVFPYIQQPIFEAQALGKPTVEINPGQTEISSLVDFKISLGAAEALSRIWNAYQRAQ